MADMTSQMEAELAFWRELVIQHGEYYYAYRVAEYYDKTCRFPSYLKGPPEGGGLDIGCGCISVFEGANRQVDGWDVLATKYNKLYTLDTHVKMYQLDDTRILRRDNFYEWAACINMIDHTPDTEKLLAEIQRVMVPRGRLYFEVNLERGLAAPHHRVWTAETVREVMHPFFDEVHTEVQPVPEHNQLRYWAEMISKKKG
jgi:2-polyprenyl-3-methyl-5-hydroxy-6-metoxy-1,4-benzoquinol methylase